MQGTASSEKMRRQVKEIYEMLGKFGYPALLSKEVLTGDKEMSEFMSEYFQPTPKRENLIEWLILQNYPLYQQEIDKGDKKGSKKKSKDKGM